ncbi:DUF445 domain containing protein [Nitzschia inconspicua]|uniref:DUF445 domain containing protein n=1 Tax=Nitzschia inconspicua TaxID=303405 RepID=A0A9K3LQ77_9STRA|nr:DUF445 domain containing protein [Nitzschia inconspicua]
MNHETGLLKRPTTRVQMSPPRSSLLLLPTLILLLLVSVSVDPIYAFSPILNNVKRSYITDRIIHPNQISHPLMKKQQKQNLPSRMTASFPLTTVPRPLEDGDGSNNDKGNIFQNAKRKFQERPGTYLLIPLIAAFVGWFTNYLAVQMIFYPIQFRGIPLYRRPEVPLGLLGWQGIVPCKTRTMSQALVNMVTKELLTVPEAFERLNPKMLAKYLAPQVPDLGNQVIQGVLSEQGRAVIGSFPMTLWSGVTHHLTGLVQFCNVRILTTVMKDLICNCQDIFSLENCVVNQMLLDRAKLGELFRKVGKVELDFLTNSGLWFGFLLGLIQMAVALVWENPWSLSIGGMIVGLATNWLALKWIFEPVNPTQIGPFIVQGMFLRRQKEVAAEFSKFFASNIVTSQQIWNSILTDPSTTPALAVILSNHVRRLLKIVSFGLFQGSPSEGTIQKVTLQTILHLPKYLSSGLHGYVDKTLGLEQTLRIKMEALSPAKFERVLHPIFEEDELTLILAGGALGFAAGLIQQGIETGAIKLSNPLPRIRKLLEGAWHSMSSLLRQLSSRKEPPFSETEEDLT